MVINGLTITNATDTFSSAITGVTINLKSAKPGTTTQLGVARDPAAATEAVESFVEGYNKLVKSLAALGSYDADTGAAGALQGDSTLRQIQANIRGELQGSLKDFFADFRTLSSIGITTDPGS